MGIEKSRILRTCAVLTIAQSVLTSACCPALSAELTPEQAERIRIQISDAAKRLQEESAARENILKSLADRLSNLEGAQKRATEMQAQTMAMLGQLLKSSSPDAIKAVTAPMIAEAERAKSELEDLKKQIAERGKQVSGTVEKEIDQGLNNLINLLPDKDAVSTYGKTELEKLRTDMEAAKRDLDARMRRFLNDTGHEIARHCGKPDEARVLLAEARSKQSNGDLAAFFSDHGCRESAELARRLAQVHSVEQAEAAFQLAMSNLMMAALASGNPYVVLITAVLSALIALFQKGGGGGDGSGSGNDKGDNARTEQTSVPGTVDGGTKQPPSPAPSPTPPSDQRDPSAFLRGEMVQTRPGFGCKPSVNGTSLTLSPNSQPAYIIDMANVDRAESQSFPSSWTDKSITLVECQPESRSVLVSVGSEGLCFNVIRGQTNDKYVVRYMGYVRAGENACDMERVR